VAMNDDLTGSFARLLAPVVTTTSIIFCFNKQRLTQVHLENSCQNGEREKLYLMLSNSGTQFAHWRWQNYTQFCCIPRYYFHCRLPDCSSRN